MDSPGGACLLVFGYQEEDVFYLSQGLKGHLHLLLLGPPCDQMG